MSFKGEQFLHKKFGDELQKQMDEDMQELIKAEQKTGSKLQPAFMAQDYFDEQRQIKQLKRR